jgi:hypothetical protein
MASRTLTLTLDEEDYAVVLNALARRQAFGRAIDGERMPKETESDRAGAALVEICRWFNEYLSAIAKETALEFVKGDAGRLTLDQQSELLRWLKERHRSSEDPAP